MTRIIYTVRRNRIQVIGTDNYSTALTAFARTVSALDADRPDSRDVALSELVRVTRNGSPCDITLLVAGEPVTVALSAQRTDPIDPFRFTTSRRAGRDWWSLRPVVRPEVHSSRNPEWARSPIDRFVLSKLEASGLSPAPEADRRSLIRPAGRLIR